MAGNLPPPRSGLKLPPEFSRPRSPGPLAKALRDIRETGVESVRTAEGSSGLLSGAEMIRRLQPADYDPQGADFSEWMNRLGREAHAHWVLPPSVLWGAAKGRGVVEMVVGRDGTILRLEILVSSGNDALDRSVLNALRSSTLLPLPSDYRPETFPIRILFSVVDERSQPS
jgi:TonB family protein